MEGEALARGSGRDGQGGNEGRGEGRGTHDVELERRHARPERVCKRRQDRLDDLLLGRDAE